MDIFKKYKKYKKNRKILELNSLIVMKLKLIMLI